MKNLYVIILLILFFSTHLTISGQFKNTRISKLTSKTPEEVTIAINPLKPDQVAAGANINFFYSSNDGGQLWAERTINSSLGVWGDPCVVYDGLGNLYFAHLSNPIQGYWIDRIVVQKSTDNGQSWNDGVGVWLTTPKNQDKEWLAVDLTNSPYRNNIYVAWTEFDHYGSSNPNDSSRILFSKSTDQGETWSHALKISDVSGNCFDGDETVEGAVPAVGLDGEIYISWAGPLGLVFDKSTDGGNSFGKDIVIANMPGGWAFDIPGINRCNGMPVTACDISNSPYRGNIYVLWSDQRNGTNNTDVFFIKSPDKGNTWSDIKKVNDDDTERHQFFCWMTVDSTTGIIYSIFYDRRNTSGVLTDVNLARSSDGGETFTNHKISESSFEPTASVFFGDYTNIAAYRRIIRPIWMRMDGYDLSIWTAKIKDEELITGFTEEEQVIPNEFKLFQNYPNPFNSTTIISYSLPVKSNIQIKIYDTLGNLISEKDRFNVSPGIYESEFDASNLTTGVYYLSVSSGSFKKSLKMLYLK